MYQIRTTEKFNKEFKKLDKPEQKILKSWIDKNISGTNDPRSKGKALKGKLKTFWRYRIGDYRLICIIEDDELIITAISVRHRRIYKSRN